MPPAPPPACFDAVVFDFGGVLASSPFDHIDEAGQAMGLAPGVLLRLMMGDYFEDGDHAYHRLERGEIPFAEWFADLLARAEAEGIELDFSGVGPDFYGGLAIHEEVVAEVRALRAAGYRTAILTNNVREFGQWREKLPLDDLFDDVIDSCEVGMRKPNPAIYALACERLGVEPARAVFLDDAEGNVEAARRAGLAAIHVVDPAAAVAELRTLLASTHPSGPA